MFRRIVASGQANIDKNKAKYLFRLHPSQLSTLLELAWGARVWKEDVPTGTPDRRSDIPSFLGFAVTPPTDFHVTTKQKEENNEQNSTKLDNDSNVLNHWLNNLRKEIRWDHLIYAYLIENTRIYEIMRRVLWEYRMGERLGVPTAEAQHWLRNTEELFFRDPASFSIYSVVSSVRPDSAAVRRNAYYRMFGMDLNHGTDKNEPYPYIKAETANRAFTETFEEFLREVWVAITNRKNESGVSATDDAAICDLANRLHDMLIDRRKHGNLAREEFYAVAMMSWFHLALEFDSPIVESLRAESTREEQRLFKIAERVKLPAHDKSYHFFLLADPLSRLFTQIELETYNKEGAIPALYEEGSPVEKDMKKIITHWSQATGKNLKLRSRSVTITK